MNININIEHAQVRIRVISNTSKNGERVLLFLKVNSNEHQQQATRSTTTTTISNNSNNCDMHIARLLKDKNNRTRGHFVWHWLMSSGDAGKRAASPLALAGGEQGAKRRRRSSGGSGVSTQSFVLGNCQDFLQGDLRQRSQGPETVRELFKWPERICEGLTTDGIEFAQNNAMMIDNLHRHFIDTINAYTDYSGMECPRWAWEPTETTMNEYFKFGLLGPRAVFRRSCDNGIVQNKVLRHICQGH